MSVPTSSCAACVHLVVYLRAVLLAPFAISSTQHPHKTTATSTFLSQHEDLYPLPRLSCLRIKRSCRKSPYSHISALSGLSPGLTLSYSASSILQSPAVTPDRIQTLSKRDAIEECNKANAQRLWKTSRPAGANAVVCYNSWKEFTVDHRDDARFHQLPDREECSERGWFTGWDRYKYVHPHPTCFT